MDKGLSEGSGHRFAVRKSTQPLKGGRYQRIRSARGGTEVEWGLRKSLGKNTNVKTWS